VQDYPAFPVECRNTGCFLSPVLLGEKTFRNQGGRSNSAS
jgi:hypothetical protein